MYLRRTPSRENPDFSSARAEALFSTSQDAAISIDRRVPQCDFHDGGYGLRHQALSPIRSGKDVPEVSAVPVYTHLYHSKQVPVFFSCDDVRKGNRVGPSILAEGDKLLGCLDRSVRNPLKVASYFNVLRVGLKYPLGVRRYRAAQTEPYRLNGIWKHRRGVRPNVRVLPCCRRRTAP